MEEKKENTWGGAMQGEGRKPQRGNVKSIAIRIPQDIADILEKQDSKTDYIIEAIRYYEKNK